MLEPGTVLFGKYRIQWVLGSGGMGTVVRAEHVQLKKPVAIKFVASDAPDDALVAKRFVREAQAAVQLTSEHVCRVHDVGTLDDGSPYMVMEYLDGVCLDEFLRQGEPAPLLDGDLPPGLADAVARCLQKDPADRFANVAELAAALAPHASMPGLAAGTVARLSRILGVAEVSGSHETGVSVTLAPGVQVSTLTGSAGQIKHAGHRSARRHARGLALVAGILAVAATLAVVVRARAPGVETAPATSGPAEPRALITPAVDASTTGADANHVDEVDIEFEVIDVDEVGSNAGAEDANAGQGDDNNSDARVGDGGKGDMRDGDGDKGDAKEGDGDKRDGTRRRKARGRRAGDHSAREQTREDDMFGTRK